MIIRKVKIYGFGRFMNCEFEPDKNNFLSAAKGLMTDTELFFEFVRAMLYGLSARDGTGTRFMYMPEEMYDNLGRRVRYGGELFYDACGKNYQLSCLWGNSKAEDLCRIIDTKSGRDVKIETGKTVGEKTLHISEAAFVSAVKATGAAVNSGDEGVYSIGKLSALMGLNDGKPSHKEVRLGLENKLLELTDPKTKNGKLDRLVINKMNMRNALSRIGEKDGRFAKLRASLETAEAELANIDAELADSKRTFGLCDAA
ncbi:MAG: hypothetical protein J6112_08340, partial [Clostridia bacterium]|nr:hypothetical protein [Clostridia bacterium]